MAKDCEIQNYTQGGYPMMPEINICDDEHFVVEGNQLVKYTGNDDVLAIPEGIMDIGKGCFAGNVNLRKVKLPNSLKIVSKNAFLGCSNLEEIEFNENLTDIGAKAFMECSSLQTITFPSNLCLLGEDILTGTGVYDNKSNWHDGMLIINDCVLDADKNMEGECDIPDGCRVVAQYAFKECEKIESVTMPNSVIAIGKHAFDTCKSLKWVKLSQNLSEISKSCFRNCYNLMNIDIPNSITIIRNGAFANCTSLKNVILPPSVEEIFAASFHGCSKLKDMLILCKNPKITGDFISENIEMTIRGLQNSSVHQYAISNNIKFVPLINRYSKNGDVNLKLAQKYISIINKIYYKYESVTDEDISTIKGMCNRCIRHDQRDWQATWDCMGRPSREVMNVFVDDAFLVRNKLREMDFDALLEFRQKYFAILNCVYNNLTSMNIISRQDDSEIYKNDSVFDIKMYYEVDGIDYSEVYISLIEDSIKKKICKRLNKAIEDLLTAGECENVIDVYKHQMALLSNNFQSFFSKFNDYINFCEAYLNQDDYILEECREYADFIENTDYSREDKYAYYYACGVIAKKREKYKIALKFFEKAIAYSNGNNEKVIDQMNKCEKSNLKLIQTLFLKFESGDKNAFDDVAEVKVEDNCIYVDDCLMSVNEDVIGDFYIKDFCRHIGAEAFSCCKGISEIICPAELKTIAPDAFYCCAKLKNINIPESLREIGSYAFSGCTSLEKISLPKAMTHIADGLFEYCGCLNEICIPNQIEKIGEDSFMGCNSLKSIVIPKSVKEIKKYAFFMCEKLKYIEIESGKIDIGEGNFDNILEDKWYESIKIVGYENSGADVFARENCFEFESKGVSEYDDFNINKDILRKYNGCKENVEIPKGIKVIGDDAFKNCLSLKTIVIPDSVIKICASSFAGCSNLEKIILPSDLIKIDTSAFEGCSNLSIIELPEKLEAIYEKAFSNCTGLREILIPISVKKIKPNIFSGCPEDMVIRGCLFSEAKRYADKYQINFIDLNREEKTIEKNFERFEYNDVQVEDNDFDDFLNDMI